LKFILDNLTLIASPNIPNEFQIKESIIEAGNEYYSFEESRGIKMVDCKVKPQDHPILGIVWKPLTEDMF
jgi:hypothetical protein